MVTCIVVEVVGSGIVIFLRGRSGRLLYNIHREGQTVVKAREQN